MKGEPDYVELHCHSCFSLLDGASTPEALLDRARELEMSALALTDHDGLYAAVRFALAAEERGILPLLGAELTLTEEPASPPGQTPPAAKEPPITHHLVLLAENREGYRHLSRLISQGQLAGEKGHPRLSWQQLAGQTAGLIALTGCRQGLVLSHLLAGKPRQALDALARWRELFGRGQVYVELQQHLHPQDRELVAELAHLARQARLPLVVTNNVHYARREAHLLQDVLVAIRHQQPLSAMRPLLRPNSEYYLKSHQEMAALFARYPAALAHTVEIAGRCRVPLAFREEATSPALLGLDLPPEESLARLCREALPSHYQEDIAAARKQLDHELAVICQAGLAGYFLLVWDIVRFSRERGILVRGRGSAANSIVAYLLGITNVDPLAHHLLFERFLSAETRTMPDIDLDFCARRREEVIQYLYEKYGEAHVGMVCNYVTYRERSAIRDVGKALGLPTTLIDRLAKSQGKWGSSTENTRASTGTEEPQFSPALWEQFRSLCAGILGFPRHLSIHVGGMCITRAPLNEIVPLERATMPGRVVIQWDKEGVEDAGLIKIDLLCLRTLSAIDECLHLIRETRGEVVDLDALPLDDPAVYAALQRADTIGAFQVESRAQQQALVQMKPRCFADLIVEISLIRPGPLQGNMVHPFFRRRKGLEPVRYPHPLLKSILAETLGIVVFQEQVIRIAMVLGRFNAGEADQLRRAMSRHRSQEAMASFRQRFVQGALAQGVPQITAETMFDRLQGFASYGFCKSHAAAFARTAYDTLYLRAHYPAEYYCAILNNEPMGFYAPRVIVGDARRHGVPALSVHANRSAARCTVEAGAIRLGLLYVDGLGETGAQRVVEARPAEGFHDLAHFCRCTRLPRRLVEHLILAGGMVEWERDKRRLVWELGRLHYTEEELPLPLPEENVSLDPMTYAEELLYEYGVTGVSAQGHLMELFREQLQAEGIGSSRDLEQMRAGQQVRVAGWVAVRQAPPTAKGFAFFSLEDEWGMMNIIVRPDVFQAQREVLVSARVLVIQGLVERADGQVNVLAERGWRLR